MTAPTQLASRSPNEIAADLVEHGVRVDVALVLAVWLVVATRKVAPMGVVAETEPPA